MKHQQTINAFRLWAKNSGKQLPAGTNKELEKLLDFYQPDQPLDTLLDYYMQSLSQAHDELAKLVQLRFCIVNSYIDYLYSQTQKKKK
ncbi:MAG: hypothetical protein V2A54_02405 [Bacteroidota bacterium]